MAINPVMFLLSLAFGGLGGYGFWAANANGAVGNLRAISVVLLIVSLMTNIIFSFFNFQNPAAYIIVNGIEILIFVFVGYGIFQSLK